MNIIELVNHVNALVQRHLFYEFSIYNNSNNNLTIVGSTDLQYYHDLEIHLIDIFFISSKASWIVNTQRPFMNLMNDKAEYEFNLSNKIELGYQTIQFLDQDNQKFNFTFRTASIKEEVVKYYN